MDTGSCGCGNQGCGSGISRREVLAAAAVAAVAVPAIGRAAVAVPVDDAPAGTWVSTTFKPTDIDDKSAKSVADHPVMISRDGKKLYALSTKCTHKGCTIKPKAGDTVMTCQCHKAQFDWEGAVTHPPAKLPLPHYALRLNKDGVIEVDASKPVAQDAAEGVLSIP